MTKQLNMRKLLLITLLLIHFSAFGQKVVCDLHIEITPQCWASTDEIYTTQNSRVFSFFNNLCKVTQTFQLPYAQKDTVYFVLTTPSPFFYMYPLYFQKLTVREKNTDKEIPFVFQSDTLRIVQPPKLIEISYYYMPDYFMYGNEWITCIFAPYQQSWFSWYFSVPDMKINKLTFDVPEHLYFFSNLMRKTTEGETIRLCTDSIPKNGISFFWAEKRYYERIETTVEANQYNLYLYKDAILTGDTTSCYAALLPAHRVNESMINSRISNLNRVVPQVEKMFQKKVNFDILEACLDIYNEDDTIRWGSLFQMSDNHALIVMDTSFWVSHSYLHEIIHAYNDILPDRNDSSYYFFHESMTEYLAIYFEYSQQASRDSVFEAKILKYVNLEQEYISIFEINRSAIGFDLGGTFGVVYLKTPFVINSFAKRIGVDKFITILSHFYQQVRETQYINFYEFEKTLKSYGVSNDNWDWFVKHL